ncbi:MAG TPA: flagellar motor switch protein FliN [Actinomycetes bacterium]|nr:flagellar motor switch protein FliN [Actinomycetes bacterium]
MSTTAVSESLVAAAQAAAAHLPAPAELNVGEPASDPAAASLPADAAVAVCARLTGAVVGEVVVVVARELVDALAQSPLGALEVAPAVQPALDAAAAALGQVQAEGGRELPVDVALSSLTGKGVVAIVPLLADGAVHATVAFALTPAATPRTRPASHSAGLELLRDVEMEVTAELGRTRMTVRELLSLTPGAVVELDRAAGSPADLLVNGTLIARGEVVVVDEEFGIRITEIVAPAESGVA